MNEKNKNTDFLWRIVEKHGKNLLFGVALLEEIDSKSADEIREIAKKMKYAVVIGHPVSRTVLQTITDKPNIIYKHHYQQLNWALDRIALEVSTIIESEGFRGLAIPASSIVDWEKQSGHFSHRHAAIAAGLAWMGRNGLAVTLRFGSQIRWASILTDIPLECGSPIEMDCGECRACMEICPANAISMIGCDVKKCYDKLSEFSKIQGVGQHICGLCIKVCGGKSRWR